MGRTIGGQRDRAGRPVQGRAAGPVDAGVLVGLVRGTGLGDRAEFSALAGLVGLVGVAGALMGHDPARFAVLGYVAMVTVPLSLSDIRERRLPNILVLPGFVVAGVGGIGAWAAGGAAPWKAFAVCVVVLCALGVMAVGGGLGLGDVKLAGMLALALGVSDRGGASVGSVVLAGMVAFGTAGIAALAEWRRGSDGVPLGPFLLGGFWVAVVSSG
ncbi:prepilin peptidase [Leifsonia sp. NPDC058292]|uniref:prepilin peptidase n=1 Tax=Leifsonia sp. NPDC058292 TaxID=3346428 RepID=UPI0036DA3405